jgi:hypothetical protein
MPLSWCFVLKPWGLYRTEVLKNACMVWDINNLLTPIFCFSNYTVCEVSGQTIQGWIRSLEQNLTAARDEVDAEISLASEQKAHGSRKLQQIEHRKNERYRSCYQVEVQENRIHPSL